jgi:hypothetical protein
MNYYLVYNGYLITPTGWLNSMQYMRK